MARADTWRARGSGRYGDCWECEVWRRIRFRYQCQRIKEGGAGRERLRLPLRSGGAIYGDMRDGGWFRCVAGGFAGNSAVRISVGYF